MQHYYFTMIAEESYATYDVLHRAEDYQAEHDTVMMGINLNYFMRQSLFWIDAYWEGIGTRNGLPDDRAAVIDHRNLPLLTKIVAAYQQLFELAPETISFYQPRDDEGHSYDYQPEESRTVILAQLNDLQQLLQQAGEQQYDLLYRGINE
ncbi:hypothetical protein [Lactiplantibacillus herbarum]|uniref:hypothetical protein n=1 Tax=Lactiplantibacillus herbarum TaxID=1670446 RepID=UPI00064F2898|nr:hypothetical protein [Lactiplantibacillus herbarum]